MKYAEDQERRFCFEVVTPNKSCMLQADSDAQRKKWMAYLEAGVARALRISFSAKVGVLGGGLCFLDLGGGGGKGGGGGGRKRRKNGCSYCMCVKYM